VANQVEILLGRARWATRAVERHRGLAFGVMLAVALFSAAALAFRPDRYEARARVYVDTQTVLKPLMAGLTFQPDVDQQVRMLARTLVSRPNVERLVAMPELQLMESGPVEREQLVTQLMEQIKLDSAAAGGNIYDISFRGTSPERAERLVAATLEMFVNAGVGSKKRDSEDAGKFIEGEILAYEAKLVEAENRVKDFKMRNFGVSGVSDRDYFSRVSALSEGVEKLRIELASAERSRDAYRRELALEDPQLPVEPGSRATGPVPEIETRLVAQKKQLDELLGRYTEGHPDVIATRRIVNQLEAEAAEHQLAEGRAQAGKSVKPGTAATSPVYQRLRISLAEAEARVAALHSQLSTQQGQLEQTRALAGRAPVVEAELAQLNRDYDVIRKNYDQMVARRESALLGAKLDESTQLAEFRVIEPPRVSPNPVRPARWHLALAAIILSLAAGTAAAAMAEGLRPTFDEARALREFSGRPVVGTVSMRLSPSAARQRQASSLVFTAAVGVLLLLQIAWVAWMALHPRAG
jgi:polysaccharide chain length determinant protein (PEP-CTERM system associated)